MTSQASIQYERARNTSAFNVLGASQTAKNQYGARYTFPDGSWLICSHYSNSICHGDSRGGLAIRRLWDDRSFGEARRESHRALRIETENASLRITKEPANAK